MAEIRCYHFPETLAFRDRLMAAWDLNVRTIRAHASPVTGTNCRDLYRSDSDLCCRIHKVEPFRRVTREQGVWLSGIRWDQTSSRSHLRVVEEGPDETIRIHPMLSWDEADLWSYMLTHDLPRHPVHDEGYRSGCAPCTGVVQPSEDARRGRWVGKGKRE